MMRDGELTDKQKRFCQEYIIDLNATQAAIRAGYSEKTAQQISSRLLLNVVIQGEISKLQKEISERTGLTIQWVLDNLKEVSERCMQKTPVMKFDRTEKRMVQVIDDDGKGVWTFDSPGANRSLELLGKHLGMFKDKLDVSHDFPKTFADFIQQATKQKKESTEEPEESDGDDDESENAEDST